MCYALNRINFHTSFAPTFRSGNIDIQYNVGYSPVMRDAEIYPFAA